MKKILVSIFAVFYLGIASGATVHFHYCMGELLSWGLTQPEDSNCSNCGMEKSDAKDCCKDEQRQVKIEKAQKAERNFQFSQLVSTVIASHTAPLAVADLTPVTVMHPLTHAPPRTAKEPVFLRNCSFLI